MGLNCCMDPWLFGFSSMIYGVLMPTGQTLQLFLTPWAASHIAVAPSSAPSLSPTAGRPAPHPRSHQLLPMSILRHLLVSPGDDLLRAATCPWGAAPEGKRKSGRTATLPLTGVHQRPSHSSLLPPPLLAMISFLVVFPSFSFWLLKSDL